MSHLTPDGHLTPAAVLAFERDGFLVVDDVLAPVDLQPVIDELGEEIDRRAAALVAAGDLSRDYAEYGFEHRLAHISAETDQLARAIWNGVLDGPAIFGLLTHPRLLNLAESLCGEEIIASSAYRLRPKIPNYGYGAVPWHQDSGYFEPFCDRGLVLTVWIPLVDATPDNGCLWAMPGVHQGEVARHRLADGQPYLVIPDEYLPAGEPVCCPVRKGGALLLSNKCPHVSYDNRTDIVRWSMDLRFQSAALPTNAPMTRLADDAVPGDGVPVACYPPEADFLVRSRMRPDEVVSSAAAFQRLRREHAAQPVTDRWGRWWEQASADAKT
jgi:hypothetical protein